MEYVRVLVVLVILVVLVVVVVVVVVEEGRRRSSRSISRRYRSESRSTSMSKRRSKRRNRRRRSRRRKRRKRLYACSPFDEAGLRLSTRGKLAADVQLPCCCGLRDWGCLVTRAGALPSHPQQRLLFFGEGGGGRGPWGCFFVSCVLSFLFMG